MQIGTNMLCEKCKNAFMSKNLFNYVPLVGYSKIYQFVCPECDYTYKQVA
jgi:C4-type Zn-finger protein